MHTVWSSPAPEVMNRVCQAHWQMHNTGFNMEQAQPIQFYFWFMGPSAEQFLQGPGIDSHHISGFTQKS